MTTDQLAPRRETPAAIEARLRRLCPLYEHIGMRVESVGDVVAVTVPLIDANVNHLGGMHAAVQWAVAEALGGIGFLVHPELGDCWIVVRDVTIAFERVARTGLRAEAAFDAALVAGIASQLDATGRADYEVAITLRDTTGEVVTTATARYHLRRNAS